MERILNTMQDPDKLSDPRVTVVQTAGDVALFPQIAGYRVVKKLGQGGMATVFMATQESLDRPVSIKVMERETLQDETSMQRFENEARTIAKLTHPSIVAIYEVGRTADDRMYYTMPYLPNGDLAQRDLGKDEPRIVALLRTLLSALDYAHTRGIVHRDVKRENVLFDSDNRPLLADFGIALSKSDTVRITTAGLAVGSSGYMAPEQARGDAVDGRADLYSVGVLAYELLTGELPYRSNDALALALMHVQKDIPRLPPAKRQWQPFIDRAMAKSPDDRFSNAKQMLDEIDRIERRSGNHLTQRMLRTLDRTAPGVGWKRPRMLALLVALLIAGGVYAARDRLPWPGYPGASTQPQASAASPVAHANTPTNSPANAAIAPASSPAATASASPASAFPTTASATAASPATHAPTAIPPVATASSTQPPPVTSTAAAPVTSLAASPTAAAVSSAASTAAASVALANARAALDRSNLTEPHGRNAVDLTLAAWELAPATPDSTKLVNDVLKALAAQEAFAIEHGNDPRAIACEQKGELLDNATVGESAPAWKALRASASSALTSRARKESRGSDSQVQSRTQSLAQQLNLAQALASIPAHSAAQVGVPASSNGSPQTASTSGQQADSSQPPSLNASASTSSDPVFVKLHDRFGLFPAAAIARTDVTRGDYAAFANATHRPSADCASAKAERDAAQSGQQFGQGQGRFGQGGGRFGQRLRNARGSQSARLEADASKSARTWTDPGFAQNNNEPVVCVSWDDANSYAQWLGLRNGRRYRLPSASEWRLALAAGSGTTGGKSGKGTVPAMSGSANSLGLYGLDGNVSEWLLDCAVGCDRRQVAGRSWRDRSTDLVPSGRLKQRGFDDVGFRIVEVLGVRK
jgi:serine/threonine-protein kinase PpkA